LPAPPSPGPPAPGRPERLIELGDFLINGRTMDMGRIDELVPLGSTEVWRIHNTVDIPHNFHIHNAGFEVLDIDGRPPEPWMRGRKDTVYARPGSQMRLLVQFGQYAGTEPPYMFHCHLLAHEDANMMGQFALVEPGTDRHSHGHH
jgi:FtsP/CotA-like multicopper oxidase with cupredoxin domain